MSLIWRSSRGLRSLTGILSALLWLSNCGCVAWAAEIQGENRLVLLQGSILNVYYDQKYIELKRADYFYGYGWLDKSHVFVAYQPEGEAEAFAVVEVLDIPNSGTKKILVVGGAGESNFDINPYSKEIVFNDSDGIKLLRINLVDYSYRLKVLKKGLDSWGIFWINSNTVGYMGQGGLQSIHASLVQSQ